MGKKIIPITIFIFFQLTSIAQIKFTNPGFEGNARWSVPPDGWDSCSGSPDCANTSLDPPGFLAAYQGQTYLGLQSDISGTYSESAGQYPKCNLIEKKNHVFTLYAYEVSYIEFNFLYAGGRVQFWGGFGQCDLDTLLWQSPVLDTLWQQYTVAFTPSKSYNYVTFVANNINNEHSYIGVDDLSDITVEGGYNFLSATISDTVIKQDSCVALVAISEDSSAAFQWSSLPIGFTKTGSTVTACPDSNTQYICTAISGCGFQRSDTLPALRVIRKPPPPPIEQIIIPTYITAYDNPAEWHIINLPTQTQVILYNTLGQVIYISNNYSNNFQVARLAAGSYFYRLTLSTGEQRTGRLVVVR